MNQLRDSRTYTTDPDRVLCGIGSGIRCHTGGDGKGQVLEVLVSWIVGSAIPEPMQWASMFDETGEVACVLQCRFVGGGVVSEIPEHAKSCFDGDGFEVPLPRQRSLDWCGVSFMAGQICEIDGEEQIELFVLGPKGCQVAFIDAKKEARARELIDLGKRLGAEMTGISVQPIGVIGSTFILPYEFDHIIGVLELTIVDIDVEPYGDGPIGSAIRTARKDLNYESLVVQVFDTGGWQVSWANAERRPDDDGSRLQKVPNLDGDLNDYVTLELPLNNLFMFGSLMILPLEVKRTSDSYAAIKINIASSEPAHYWHIEGRREDQNRIDVSVETLGKTFLDFLKTGQATNKEALLELGHELKSVRFFMRTGSRSERRKLSKDLDFAAKRSLAKWRQQ